MAVKSVCSYEGTYHAVCPISGNGEGCTFIFDGYKKVCEWVPDASDFERMIGRGSSSGFNDAFPFPGGGGAGRSRQNEVEVARTVKESSLPDPCETTGRPVAIPTGDKLLFEPDILLPADAGVLAVFRTYRKTQEHAGVFGRGWSGNIEHTLVFEYADGSQCAGSLASTRTCSQAAVTNIYLADGPSAIKFTPAGSGVWLSETRSIVQDGSSWRVEFPDGRQWQFNGAGQPLTLLDERGIGLTYAYNGSGALATITHTSGRTLSFAWTNGKVGAITAPNGKVYSYTYNGAGYLASVTYPDNLGTRSYHYEDSRDASRLTGISINGVRYSRYAYQADGRVAWSGLENGVERSTFAYTDTTTAVTNVLGQTTTYYISAADGARRIVGVERPPSPTCSGSMSPAPRARTRGPWGSR